MDNDQLTEINDFKNILFNTFLQVVQNKICARRDIFILGRGDGGKKLR